MSTIKVDELLAADGTTTTPPTIPALDTRFCTAWVNFKGNGTVAIRDSYNVASISDDGTGSYTVNYAVALADINYSLQLSTSMGQNRGIAGNFADQLTATSKVWTYISATGALEDSTSVSVAVFGGQA